MTKKQRLLTAVQGEIPDMVPVAPIIHWRFANALLGRYHWKDTLEAHRIVGSIPFRYPISIGPHSDFDVRWGMDIRMVEESDTEKRYEKIIDTPTGTLVAKHIIGFDPRDPTLGFGTEYFVKALDDWHIVIDYWQRELAEAGLPSHQDIDEAAQILGEDGVASVVVNSAFARGSLMRGMQGMMYDLIDAPDLMREVLALALELRKQEIRSFLESKADVMVYDICWATGAQIGPKSFDTWVAEEIEQAADMIRPVSGKYFGLYTLGKIRELLPTMVSTQPDFIASFEQNEGDITLAEAKQRYGDRVCLMGNFDPLILQDGTVDEARREARRCLDEGMANGGYVMSTGDEVPPTTKLENLQAMVDVAEEYGRYE